jgi:hypothetical protein
MRKRKILNSTTIDKEKWANEFMGNWKNLAGELVTEMKDKPEFDGLFPPVQRVFAATVGLDLVEVKPMSAPDGMLHYFNTHIVYTDEEQIEMDAERWMRKNIEWTIMKTNQIKQ